MKRSISIIALLIAMFSIVLIESGCGSGASADDTKGVNKPIKSPKHDKLNTNPAVDTQ
jgi:hypothetical protein